MLLLTSNGNVRCLPLSPKMSQQVRGEDVKVFFTLLQNRLTEHSICEAHLYFTVIFRLKPPRMTGRHSS